MSLLLPVPWETATHLALALKDCSSPSVACGLCGGALREHGLTNHRICQLGTCGSEPSRPGRGDTPPGEPKARMPPAPGPLTPHTAASPPPAGALMRDRGLWGVGPLPHSPECTGSGERQEPSPVGSPVAPSSDFIFLSRAARRPHPSGKGKQEKPKEEGQSPSRPGPGSGAASSPFPRPLPLLQEGAGCGVHSTSLSSSKHRLGNF